MAHSLCRTRIWTLAPALLFWGGGLIAAARTVTLTFMDATGEVHQLTFDSSRISEEEVKSAALLDPHVSAEKAISPNLERCREPDPEYFPYGSGDPGCPHSFENEPTASKNSPLSRSTKGPRRKVWLLAGPMPTAGRGEASPRPVTLTFTDPAGDMYRLTFDPKEVPEAQIKALIFISPGFEAFEVSIAPALEQCGDGDPHYLPCGSRGLDDPHFLENALVNLDIGTKRLAYLEALQAPKELEPVIKYEKEFLSFSLWLQRSRYYFYRSWDTEVLKRKYGDLDPSVLCTSVISGIDRAASKQQKYELARYDWHTCVNSAFFKQHGWSPEGGYPRDAWKHFLSTHGIKEQLIEQCPD